MSRDSVAAFVEALGPKDRFELLTFNVQARTAVRAARRPPRPRRSREARTFLDAQQAQGGTSLLPGPDPGVHATPRTSRSTCVVLSDGLTEQGERQPLLGGLASRPKGTRVFCIGVGNDVNRPLLEQLAEESGGLAAFLSRGDDFERQAQAFRAKLARPEATDLGCRFSGVEVFDVEPQRLPNLYHGAPLRVYGRYRGGGQVQVPAHRQARARRRSSRRRR